MGAADLAPAAVDQPRAAATPRRTEPGTPTASVPATAEGVLWTSEADPVKRRRWYTDDELAAVQVVKTDRGDGYWGIIAGELLGTVEPHRTARGGRSGWQARHRSGPTVEHFGTGKRPATRDAAVIDLIASVQHAWNTHRERRKRDAARRRLER
jgi:hypothetical protein